MTTSTVNSFSVRTCCTFSASASPIAIPLQYTLTPSRAESGLAKYTNWCKEGKRCNLSAWNAAPDDNHCLTTQIGHNKSTPKRMKVKLNISPTCEWIHKHRLRHFHLKIYNPGPRRHWQPCVKPYQQVWYHSDHGMQWFRSLRALQYMHRHLCTVLRHLQSQ